MSPNAFRAFAVRIVLAVAMLVAGSVNGRAHDEPQAEIASLSARGALSARNHLRRGELYRLTGQWALAAADYGAASGLGAPESEIAACRAALALDRGQPEEALALSTGLLARDGRDERALELCSQSHEALGRPLAAAEALDRLLATTKAPTPEHYLTRARLVLSAGPRQTGRALRGLDQGLARLGPLVTLASEAIQIEVERGRTDEALRRLDRIAPTLALHEALERRGAILAAAGREADARAAYAAALAEIESAAVSRRVTTSLARSAARLRAALDGGGALKPSDAEEGTER